MGTDNIELTTVVAGFLNGLAHDLDTEVQYPLTVPMSNLGDMAFPSLTHHLIGHPTGDDPIQGNRILIGAVPR